MPDLSPEDVEVGIEADEEHDVQYGPGESETTRLKSSVPEGNLEHEPEAKKRKLANVHRSKARFAQVLKLQNYNGSLQKVTKMLLDLELGKTKDHHENVTSIVEKLVCSPHDDDEKWADMFRDTVFVDDVNGRDELDKHLVIEARKTEMEFFKKNGTVPQGSQVRGQETGRQDHLDALGPTRTRATGVTILFQEPFPVRTCTVFFPFTSASGFALSKCLQPSFVGSQLSHGTYERRSKCADIFSASLFF